MKNSRQNVSKTQAIFSKTQFFGKIRLLNWLSELYMGESKCPIFDVSLKKQEISP